MPTQRLERKGMKTHQRLPALSFFFPHIYIHTPLTDTLPLSTLTALFTFVRELLTDCIEAALSKRSEASFTQQLRKTLVLNLFVTSCDSKHKGEFNR